MTTEPIGGGRPARRRDASRRATWARCRCAPVPARRYARSPVIGGRVVPPRNPRPPPRGRHQGDDRLKAGGAAMAVLRLFAGARAAAGPGRAHLPRSTVAAILDAARSPLAPAVPDVLPNSPPWPTG